MYYCGGHPFLLDIIGYEIVEIYRESNEIDVDEAAKRAEQSFIDYYEHLVELLKEDGSLNKLLQATMGPVFDLNRSDVVYLLRYGLIKEDNDGEIDCFSQHFQSFLGIVNREVDLWPLWSSTERGLRNLISATLEDAFGPNWMDNIRTRPKLKNIFERCEETQQKEKKGFGNRASDNLLDFTYPLELFAIISTEWSLFQSVFGRDRGYWTPRSEFLSKIRNPLAHNRIESLSEHERTIAEGYCKEILHCLREPST